MIWRTCWQWAVGGGIGQLVLTQFGAENWGIWLGLVIGATVTAARGTR